ncbi:hypothetical protein RDI58_019729 [Solanum bulbocastanum]|uniref:Uncharacterized protein n=1 Tax=Solanum bulbocastanum TaxID=147425 RepID=A0AAN8Y9Y5_SOLBU
MVLNDQRVIEHFHSKI